jgi:hypothetical protein
MNKHERAERLALAANVAVTIQVTFHCSVCEEVFSRCTRSVYIATRRAADEGWCVDDTGLVHCPNCAKKLL